MTGLLISTNMEWAVINLIEAACRKDDLRNLTKEQLCSLIEEVYDLLTL